MTKDPPKLHDFDAWFVGFFDGDGCVSMEICKRSTNTLGFEIVPMVQIGQAHVTGSIDSDGSIGVKINNDDHTRIGYTFLPNVVVTQLHSDRLMNALAAYCERLGIGYYVGDRHLKNPERPQYRWRVGGIDNLKKLLGPIQDKFIVKRELVDILLGDIIPRLEQGVHHEKSGFLEVMHHVDRLTSYNSSSNRKYTLAYFEELWEMDYQR